MGGNVLRIAQSTWEMPLPRAMPPSARDASRREAANREGSTSARSGKWKTQIKCTSFHVACRQNLCASRRILTSRQSRSSFHKINEKRADTIAAFIGVIRGRAEQERRLKQLCERAQSEGGIKAPCNIDRKRECGHIRGDSKDTCA
jgi:hypothetical protein